MVRESGLGAIFWSNDKKAILAALSKVSQEKLADRDALDLMRQLLLETRDRGIRNAAAMTLARVAPEFAGDAIVQALTRPDVIKNCGTLLYALEKSRNSIPLSLAIEILKNGSLEAREECLDLLEEHLFTKTDQDIESLAGLAEQNGEDSYFAAAFDYVFPTLESSLYPR